MTFGARLHDAMGRRGPLCAGIDPHRSLLRAWGYDDTPAGLERFARTAAEGLAPYVAAVKPQSAFFERFGSRGIAVLERLIADCRDVGAQVILDVKRGDIGSTTQAYADAYLDPASPLAADAITASPFLGFGSLQPIFDTARRHEAGVFVLALTSNAEGPQVQSARTASGRTVAGAVLDGLRELNEAGLNKAGLNKAGRDEVRESPLGSFGAVVGATIGSTDEDLAINGPLLVPGIGAQGGTAADVRRLFGAVSHTVLPSSSREILAAGPDVNALRERAQRSNDELRDLLGHS